MFRFFDLPLRTRVGVVTVGCWIGVFIAFWYGNVDLQAGLVRMAMMLAAMWLAWPELVVLPRWFLLALPFVLVIAAFRPWALLFILPLALLYWFIVPRKPS